MGILPVQVCFKGPFSWKAKSCCSHLFRADISNRKGLYIWTIPQTTGQMVYYVGITQRSFTERMEEHFKEHCSGSYHLNDPEELQNGIRKCIWPGLYDKENRKTIVELSQKYEGLIPLITRLLDLYQFYLAPLEITPRLLERIEAALARHLYTQDGRVGGFQEKGIYYKGKMQEESPVQAKLSGIEHIIGVPQVLEV